MCARRFLASWFIFVRVSFDQDELARLDEMGCDLALGQCEFVGVDCDDAWHGESVLRRRRKRHPVGRLAAFPCGECPSMPAKDFTFTFPASLFYLWLIYSAMRSVGQKPSPIFRRCLDRLPDAKGGCLWSAHLGDGLEFGEGFIDRLFTGRVFLADSIASNVIVVLKIEQTRAHSVDKSSGLLHRIPQSLNLGGRVGHSGAGVDAGDGARAVRLVHVRGGVEYFYAIPRD